jgi:hypothetical protein
VGRIGKDGEFLPELIPHGVVGPAVAVVAQAVDRVDPGVLQPPGDLGLQEESGAADLIVGVVVEDLLEGDHGFEASALLSTSGPWMDAPAYIRSLRASVWSPEGPPGWRTEARDATLCCESRLDVFPSEPSVR